MVGLAACIFNLLDAAFEGAMFLVADVLLLISKIQLGTIGEWVAGIGALLAVGVALWQSEAGKRQAATDLRTQLDLARIDRLHQMEREQRAALIALRRVVLTYVEQLTELAQKGENAASLPTEALRKKAIEPNLEQLTAAWNEMHRADADTRFLVVNPELAASLSQVNYTFVAWVMSARDSFVESVSSGVVPDRKELMTAAIKLAESMGNVMSDADRLLRTGFGGQSPWALPGMHPTLNAIMYL